MQTRYRTLMMGTLLVIVLIVSACTSEVKPSLGKAIVYKSPTCGCCEGYAKALSSEGFDVQVIKTDMDLIHSKFDIPMNMRSCHLVDIAGYIVEGHVPMTAVHKLLNERPQIRGIALPNMPSGTPGMPGAKKGPYRIFSLTDNGTEDYLTI
ncbi:MAG: DUF411 domain-containing protein [Candidatus Nanoarchaeia archaeon]